MIEFNPQWLYQGHWKFLPGRFAKYVFSAIIGLMTLGTLLWTFENWRGARAFDSELARLKSKGESVNFLDFQSPTIPDDQNLAAIPLFSEYIPDVLPDGVKYWKWKISETQTLTPEYLQGSGSRWSEGFLTPVKYLVSFYIDKLKDAEFYGTSVPYTTKPSEMSDVDWLQNILEYYRPIREIVMNALNSKPTFALQKIPEEPEATKFHTLAKLKAICTHFSFLSRLALEENDSEQAFSLIKINLRLADSIKNGPFGLSPHVRLGCQNVIMNPVWKGLTHHQWSEKQLQFFQEYYQNLDCLSPLAEAYRADRSLVLAGFKHDDLEFLASPIFSQALPEDEITNIKWIPKGWRKMLGIQHSRLTQMIIEGLNQTEHIDPATYAKRVKDCEEAISKSIVLRALPSNPILPRNILASVQRKRDFQTRMKMVSVVCALERYRLDFGQYPKLLENLEPNYMEEIPKDTILGESFRYFLTDNNTFRLYSIGWNAKDDKGTPSPSVTQNRMTRKDYNQGDWVWPWPGMEIKRITLP